MDISQEKMKAFVQKCEAWLDLIKRKQWTQAIELGLAMEAEYPLGWGEDEELDDRAGQLVADMMECSSLEGKGEVKNFREFGEVIKEFKYRYRLN